MIHRVDSDAMEKIFNSTNLPEDVQKEYAIVRKMADTYGHTGPLGMNLVIPMLRRLGYGKVVEKTVENVDWRRHMGAAVVAQYGDQKVDGKLVSLSTNSRLIVDTEQYGELEFPRYLVSLKAPSELDVTRDPWASVEAGAAVIVHSGDKDVRGKFVGVSEGGVLVKVGSKEVTYSSDEVELKA